MVTEIARFKYKHTLRKFGEMGSYLVCLTLDTF